MKITCGTIVTDGKNILLGHSTGNMHWDIPKGMLDSGETVIQAAQRELFEETGIKAEIHNLIFLHQQKYTKEKEICLFLLKYDKLPDIKNIKCHSMVYPEGKEPFPELDRFEYISFEKTEKYMTKRLHTILQNIKPALLSHFS